WQSLRAGRRQRSHADFLEPYYVAGVMVLQADIARLRALRLPFRLVPLFSERHVGTPWIEAGDALPVEIHKDLVARQRDNHRLPLARRLLRYGGRRRQRVDRACPVSRVTSVRDLDFIAAMHREPRPLLALR